MRILQITILALSMIPLVAQSSESTGTVTASAAEFRMPVQQPADGIWRWNRADTSDNDNEYSWTVTARNGNAQHSFGFYLYKLPGSREARGELRELLKAGQASVFEEDAQGRGKILRDAKVTVTVEDGAIVVRIQNADLVRLIFSSRPETVAVHSRTPEAVDYKVVRVTYRD